jgi:hypothetical protein
MDKYMRDLKQDAEERRSRWSNDPKKLLRVEKTVPSSNLLGEMVSSAESELEQDRLSPLRGEVDSLKELPAWSTEFQSALDLLNEAGTKFDADDVRASGDASGAAILVNGLSNSGTPDSLKTAGRIWIANNYSEVNKALTIVQGGMAFLDRLQTESVSKVHKLAENELFEGQEAFFRETILTTKGKMLIALLKFCMAFGWVACAVGVGFALWDFVGVDIIPSALSGLAVSTALTVATKVIVPLGRPSRKLCVMVFLLAVTGAMSITVSAGLLKPKGEFAIVKPSVVPIDALLLGGVCFLDLALMLGLTCITRSVLHAASALAQFKPASRMALSISTMAQSYDASLAQARSEVQLCLSTFDANCHQVGLWLLDNSFRGFFESRKKGS